MLALLNKPNNRLGLAVAWATLGEWKIVTPKYIAEHGATWNILDYLRTRKWY